MTIVSIHPFAVFARPLWITSLRNTQVPLYNVCMKRILSFMFWVAFFFSAAFLSLAIEQIIRL